MIIGTETEYSVLISDPVTNSKALAPISMLCDLVHFIGSGEFENDLYGLPTAENAADYFMSNGSRIYIDGNFIEYCTPECLDGLEARTQELWGLKILRDACEKWGERAGQYMYCDYVEQSGSQIAGHHENYGLILEQYYRLFGTTNKPTGIIDGILLPFLVSRIIWSGANALRISGEKIVRPFAPSVLSPRATRVTHACHRSGNIATPLIRIHRPEVDGTVARVCINCGDFKDEISEPFSTLTLNITSLVLTFAGQGILEPDLALEDPVAAIKAINSHRWARVQLKSGHRLNALELQREIFARIYLAKDNASYEYTDVGRPLAEHLIDTWYEMLTIHCA